MNDANKMYKPRNPIPTIDIILSEQSNINKVLLIKRNKDPFKDYFSLPGGFVNEGEKIEDAVRREARLAMKEKYPDPYYWGAFICQGNPGQLSNCKFGSNS